MYPTSRISENLKFLQDCITLDAKKYKQLISNCSLRQVETIVEILCNRDKFLGNNKSKSKVYFCMNEFYKKRA